MVNCGAHADKPRLEIEFRILILIHALEASIFYDFIPEGFTDFMRES